MQRKAESRRVYLITSTFAKQTCYAASLVERGAFPGGQTHEKGAVRKATRRQVPGLGRENNWSTNN